MVSNGRTHRVSGAEARRLREFRRTCVAEVIDVAYRVFDFRVVGANAGAAPDADVLFREIVGANAGAAPDADVLFGEIVHAERGIGQINMRGTNRMIWFSLLAEATPGACSIGDYVGFNLVEVPDERYPNGVIHIAVHLRVAAEPAYFERCTSSTLAARKL